jgi:cell fate regulator YaaT (PSP1 superfamily)
MAKEQVQKAYLYLVKIPSSNDLIVCAAESVFYPGTYVVAPTRYGQDMGVVVGSAAGLGQENTYNPGCKACLGACHFGPTPKTEEDDQRIAALGSIEDGDVMVEMDGNVVDMGPLPKFEIRSERPQTIVPEDREIDETGLWDQAYKEPEMVEIDGDALWISHIATPDEIRRYSENKEDEKEAIKICREKIAKHNLDMKLVTAHFLLSEPKVLFFFTAEDRVDFRNLVKDLVSVFRMRIELRQIGVRDESRVLGGLAVCGRDFCCHCVSDKLKPVTIKMAKEQNLSLNSMKISGPCGRLLCCLSYEFDFYLEEKQAYPAEGSRIKLGQDLFKVTEINILSHKMTVSGSEGRQFTIPRSELYFDHEKGRWEVSQRYQEEFLSN